MTGDLMAVFRHRFDQLYTPKEIEYGVWELAGYYVVMEKLLDGHAAHNMWVIVNNKDEVKPRLQGDVFDSEEPARYYSRLRAFEVIQHHYAGLRFTVEHMENTQWPEP